MRFVLILILILPLLVQCGVMNRNNRSTIKKNIQVIQNDPSGFKKTRILDASGKVRKEYTHNKKDQMVSQIHYDDNSRPDYYYEYDSAGNKIQEIHYHQDGTVLTRTFYTFQNGKKVKEEKRDSKDMVLEYSEIDYYENGYKREVRNYDPIGKLVNSFEFGEDDQLIRSNEYYPNGKRKLSYELILNKDVEKIIRYNPAGDKKIYEYKNNEKRLVQTFFNQSGIMVNSLIYDYGGRQLAKADYDEKGNIAYFYQYVYDAAGKIERVITLDVSGDLVDYF